MQRLRPCGQEVNILQFQITNVHFKNLHENLAIPALFSNTEEKTDLK